MRPFTFALTAMLLPGPGLAVDLDTFAPASCSELDRQLDHSDYILAYNDASQRAVAAFDAGHPAEACPDLLKVLRFVKRAMNQLAVCQAEVRDGRALLSGYMELRGHVTRAGRQMGCLDATPGS